MTPAELYKALDCYLAHELRKLWNHLPHTMKDTDSLVGRDSGTDLDCP